MKRAMVGFPPPWPFPDEKKAMAQILRPAHGFRLLCRAFQRLTGDGQTGLCKNNKTSCRYNACGYSPKRTFLFLKYACEKTILLTACQVFFTGLFYGPRGFLNENNVFPSFSDSLSLMVLSTARPATGEPGVR